MSPGDPGAEEARERRILARQARLSPEDKQRNVSFQSVDTVEISMEAFVRLDEYERWQIAPPKLYHAGLCPECQDGHSGSGPHPRDGDVWDGRWGGGKRLGVGALDALSRARWQAHLLLSQEEGPHPQIRQEAPKQQDYAGGLERQEEGLRPHGVPKSVSTLDHGLERIIATASPEDREILRDFGKKLISY
jgi:hypothetical protein